MDLENINEDKSKFSDMNDKNARLKNSQKRSFVIFFALKKCVVFLADR